MGFKMEPLFLFTLLLLYTTMPCEPAEFMISPTNSSYLKNLIFPCYCQSSEHASFYDWKINEEFVHFDTPGITLHREQNLAILEILCNPETIRNMSLIVCCFELANGDYYCSNPGSLRIQGRFGPVRKLRANPTSSSIELMWDPPFDSNISAVTPPLSHTLTSVSLSSSPNDSVITYSMNVSIVARSGMRTLVHSRDGINETRFTFSVENPDPSDLFEFNVSAYNRVVGLGHKCEPVQASFLGYQGQAATTSTVNFFSTSNSTADLEVTSPGIHNSSNKDDDLKGTDGDPAVSAGTDAGVAGVAAVAAVAVIACGLTLFTCGLLGSVYCYRHQKRRSQVKDMLKPEVSMLSNRVNVVVSYVHSRDQDSTSSNSVASSYTPSDNECIPLNQDSHSPPPVIPIANPFNQHVLFRLPSYPQLSSSSYPDNEMPFKKAPSSPSLPTDCGDSSIAGVRVDNFWGCCSCPLIEMSYLPTTEKLFDQCATTTIVQEKLDLQQPLSKSQPQIILVQATEESCATMEAYNREIRKISYFFPVDNVRFWKKNLEITIHFLQKEKFTSQFEDEQDVQCECEGNDDMLSQPFFGKNMDLRKRNMFEVQ